MGCHPSRNSGSMAEITKRRKMRRGRKIANLRSTLRSFCGNGSGHKISERPSKRAVERVVAVNSRELARLQSQPCHRGSLKPTRLWMRNSSMPLAQSARSNAPHTTALVALVTFQPPSRWSDCFGAILGKNLKLIKSEPLRFTVAKRVRSTWCHAIVLDVAHFSTRFEIIVSPPSSPNNHSDAGALTRLSASESGRSDRCARSLWSSGIR